MFIVPVCCFYLLLSIKGGYVSSEEIPFSDEAASPADSTDQQNSAQAGDVNLGNKYIYAGGKYAILYPGNEDLETSDDAVPVLQTRAPLRGEGSGSDSIKIGRNRSVVGKTVSLKKDFVYNDPAKKRSQRGTYRPSRPPTPYPRAFHTLKRNISGKFGAVKKEVKKSRSFRRKQPNGVSDSLGDEKGLGEISRNVDISAMEEDLGRHRLTDSDDLSVETQDPPSPQRLPVSPRNASS